MPTQVTICLSGTDVTAFENSKWGPTVPICSTGPAVTHQLNAATKETT